jgi:NAD(P)-dependent dehydrogenase (short-subunit alcohol dehydrogenase family)
MRADTAEQPAAVRHAVVTGASSGIGRAIAARLLAEGWRVTGLCRTAPAEPVEGLEIALVDVTDFERLAEVCDGLGPVDALVHAAGFMRTAPLGELSAADGAAMWRVHVDAAAFLADKLAPRMPAGGRILLIGSRTANGAPTRSQYAATKAALVGMARSWAAELAPHHRQRDRAWRHRHAVPAGPRPCPDPAPHAADRPLHRTRGGGRAGRLPGR